MVRDAAQLSSLRGCEAAQGVEGGNPADLLLAFRKADERVELSKAALCLFLFLFRGDGGPLSLRGGEAQKPADFLVGKLQNHSLFFAERFHAPVSFLWVIRP